MPRLLIEAEDVDSCCRRLIQLDISSESTIDNLKCAISEKIGIPPTDLNLVDQGGSRFSFQHNFLCMN